MAEIVRLSSQVSVLTQDRWLHVSRNPNDCLHN